MAGGSEGTTVAVRDLFDAGTLAGLDDAQLLDRFLGGQGAAGERAFEALVDRHGPAVLRACRRALTDGHAAHDAFQATFLVLARRAGSIRRRESLASWLHGVALRVSGRARRAADRRRAAERRAATLRGEAAPATPAAPDDSEAIHREIDRLPRPYREAIVLCDLDGLTYEAAARQLGCPLGTLAARVKRGRERLRVALARRGLGDAGWLPLAAPAARPLPASLVAATARLAARGATESAAGGVPAAIEVLAGRTAMFLRFEGLALGACGLIIGTIGLGAVALAASGGASPPPQAAAAPPAGPAPADAAAAVRAAFGRDSWLEQVASLRVEAEFTVEQTPAYLARVRRNLLQRDPAAQLDGDVNLLPRREGRAELAFDRDRVWSRARLSPGVEQVRAFDGRRVVAGTFPDGPDARASFVIARGPGRFFGRAKTHLPSLLVVPHRFWWAPDARDQLTPAASAPEALVAAGRVRFDGTECDVFCDWEARQRLYVADGRLRGLGLGVLERPDFAGRCAAALRRAGFAVRDDKDYLRGLDDRERREAVRTLGAHMLELTEPSTEFALEDDREVAPGRRFPFRQVVRSFLLDDQGRKALAATNTIRVVAAEVDRPLPDDLFSLAIPEGATVRDEAADPPLSYEHKASFAPAEWDAIVARGREQAARDEKESREQAARDERFRRDQAALIGRPAPDFPEGATWLQGPPARWADLAGRVVVLDFWDERYSPGLGHLPTLAQIHRERASNGLTVIGVHLPGGEPAAIEKVLRDFKLDYPTCVDVAPPVGSNFAGVMFERFGVQGFPHAVVVDRDGRVVATGRLNDILGKARDLAQPARADQRE